MILLMTVAAVVCVVQLAVVGSWGRTLRVTTLLLAVALGFYACGTVAVLLQLAWTRAFAAVTGTAVYDVVATAAWTVDPVIEEVVKVLPVVLLAWLWSRAHRQLGLTDHLLLGAALGVGFELFEAALRFSTIGSFAMSTDGGYAVRASLAGIVVVPSIWASLTTWQPVPAGFEELFSSGGDSVQHLVWTALAAVGVGWFVRRRDGWRWLGVAGLVVACLDHMNYNRRAASLADAGWFSDALAWVGARLPTVLVLLLVAVVAADRVLLARVRATRPGVLLTAEGPTGLDPRPLLVPARAGAPWSTYVTWRFVLARRAALFAEAAAVGEPHLVDAVVADKERLARASAWAEVGRRLTRRPSFAALRSWRSVVWLLALLPAVVYLVLGAFPATSGIQHAMRGTVGLWLLVAAGIGAVVLVALQVPALVGAARSVPEPSIHETRVRLQARLATAVGALVGGVLTVVVALVRQDGDRDLVSSFHALDALGIRRSELVGQLAGPIRAVVVDDQDVPAGSAFEQSLDDLRKVLGSVVGGDDHQGAQGGTIARNPRHRIAGGHMSPLSGPCPA